MCVRLRFLASSSSTYITSRRLSIQRGRTEHERSISRFITLHLILLAIRACASLSHADRSIVRFVRSFVLSFVRQKRNTSPFFRTRAGDDAAAAAVSNVVCARYMYVCTSYIVCRHICIALTKNLHSTSKEELNVSFVIWLWLSFAVCVCVCMFFFITRSKCFAKRACDRSDQVELPVSKSTPNRKNNSN